MRAGLHGLAKVLAAFLAVALSACFTEVGNPDGETTMTAQVGVDLSFPADTGADSAHITSMGLRLLAAAWRDADSVERALWPSQSGRVLNFAEGDSLPGTRLPGAPREVTIRLGRATGAGFITGTFTAGGAPRNFRFEIPDTLEFSVRYNSAALEAWRNGSDYACAFTFLPRAWLSLPGLDTARAFPDGTAADTVFFDGARNAELHRALARELSHAFNGPRAYPKMAPSP